MWRAIKQIEQGGTTCQDRAEIFDLHDRLIIALADGAGGRSGGSEAAEMVCRLVREATFTSQLDDAMICAELLGNIDRAVAADIAAGETTAVIAVIRKDEIYGASVGDSGAWWIGTGQPQQDLTHVQRRKPFVGTGVAMAVPFEASVGEGTLLIATDGLLKYTSSERICETVRANDFNVVTEKLIDLVRLKSGALPDDVAVVVCSQRS